ncbi:MAG: hypothetical protein M3450_00555 [Actinomycetota bacterium]|nr:hypothetical protein [Actinomycetota bacterium]
MVVIAEGLGGPLEVGREQPTISTAMRRALRAHDGDLFPRVHRRRVLRPSRWGGGGPDRPAPGQPPAGFAIDLDSCVSCWAGERLDLGVAIEPRYACARQEGQRRQEMGGRAARRE